MPMACAGRQRPLAAASRIPVQAQFLREALLGPAAVAHLRQPGSDWPQGLEAHLADIAHRLARA